MTARAGRIACRITALAVLLCLPLACGPSGDDVSDLAGVWINVKGLNGRPVVVHFDGRRGRLTIGTFFVYDFKIVRAVRRGNRYTLTVKADSGHRGTYDLVRLGKNRMETTAQGMHFIFRKMTEAEAARHRFRKF
jgi:hypothetical protein